MTLNDLVDIDLFNTWIAKVEILKQSGMSDNDAVAMAYREVYYPTAATTEEDSEVLR